MENLIKALETLGAHNLIFDYMHRNLSGRTSTGAYFMFRVDTNELSAESIDEYTKNYIKAAKEYEGLESSE